MKTMKKACAQSYKRFSGRTMGILACRTGAMALGVLFATVAAAAVAPAAATPAASSADWMPVDQDVWTIMMEEPQAHLLRAREDLTMKDRKGAAAEIRRADTFLKIQERRLAVSSRQMSRLAKDIESGKVISPKKVDVTFDRAVAVLDQRQTMVPIMTGADALYIDEADYHLAQAKSRLNKKDNKTAAGDIRKAEAYLKLKAVHAGEKAKIALSSSAAELETLAGKVEGGSVTVAKDLDQAFASAHKAVRRAQ